MDEKVLEEIRFHQDVVNKDASSPLYQIREKEMEISGRVLAAKSQAEKTVADARRKAVDIVKNAEAEAETAAKKHADKVLADADAEAAKLREGVTTEAKELEDGLSANLGAAVDYIVTIVANA